MLNKIKSFFYYKKKIRVLKSSKNNKIKNLFLISNIGQLGQVEALIRKFKFKNNSLAILYTKKNKKAPKIIVSSLDDSLFSNIQLIELPIFPNEINILKLIFIKKLYSYLLRNINPKKLFVLSFEKHYGLIISIAEKNNIIVNLVEEGLGTYKYNSVVEANEIILSSLSKKEKMHQFLINKLFLLKLLRVALSIQNKFHTVFVAFSELIDGVFIAERKESFFLHLGENSKNDLICKKYKSKYNISSDDIFYINQRYSISNKEYARALIDVLNIISKKLNKRIFVKLHPRDTTEFKNILLQENNTNQLIIIIDDPDFLVEPLIRLVNPEYILGIASTVLVYSNRLSSNSKIMSIYPFLRKNILDSKYKKLDDFKVVDYHFKLISKFPWIRIIEKVDDI